MRPVDCLAAALLAAWLGGCAAAPEQTAANVAPVAVEPQDAAAPLHAAELKPVVVRLTPSDEHPDLAVTCREMLKPGSNVIVKRCMTQSDWKKYKMLEARMAQQMLRVMQGNGFAY